MTLIPETHRDLAQNAAVAILTTLGPDGAPQTTAVGYLFDDGVFRISVSSDKQKLKNLQRNPQCSLFLLDVANVYHTVEVRGAAEVILDEDYTWAAKIAESNGRTADDVRKLTPPGALRYSIAVHPTKINTFG